MPSVGGGLKMNSCKTEYPIILVHGIGYADYTQKKYWGIIPDLLRDEGAEVHFGGQESYGKVIDNAIQLEGTIERILAQSGKEKVNLIAHSKGGIDARYLISQLDIGDKVASLTTMATPHKGVKGIDIISDKSRIALDAILEIFGTMLKIDGGDKPEDVNAFMQLTEDYMTVFNEMVPDNKGVYYQSYAFDMVTATSDPTMTVFYNLIKKLDGPNDGLVSVESAKWGDFKGVFTGENNEGISHTAAARGLNREDYIHNLYINIVRDLKKRGF